MVGNEALRAAAGYQAMRDRDDYFTQRADAQSGRVTKDSQGNWVRSQQYVLRPNDTTVKVLNVSLRGKDAGNLSGLSIMDFTTSLKTGRSEDLRELPWNDWLNTKNGEGEGVYRYVESPTGFPELKSMSVVFKNPQKESLKEFRTFNGRPQFGEVIIPTQEIDVEQLTLNSCTPYDFEDIPTWDSNYDSWFPGVGSYTVRSHSAGFDYRLGDGTSIDVAFYALGDGENAGDLSNSPAGGDINDIWDALRVNEGGTSPDIGSNVLEIAIDQNADY
ncbi:MAG: hypothetical protein JRJ06_09035, partial [Deltaproteobacteria bacterium]|nr:hypothetical protein [Deltaproteobacteria bacterium]